MYQSDTIAAIATSMNSSGIGIIRVSGPDSIAVVDSIFKCNKSLKEVESHTIHYGHIVDGDEIVDEVMVLIMKAPRSYTTEDSVEIDCHGGILILKRILSLACKNGARLAEPGEFTKRAFLNGRIDLSEAESVMDLISSKSDFAMKNSLKQLTGSLRNKITKLRDDILYEVAYIESALDDPEHYDLTGYDLLLKDKVDLFNNDVNELINSFSSGHFLKDGINTLIIGKPNAGKSSLLNSLSRRDRAIVTNIPGTTRDILEEEVLINGISLNIIDTAGIRDTDDVVEQIGVNKAIEQIDDADLILFVVDSSIPLDDNDFSIIERIKDKKVIILLNKSDLASVIEEEYLRNIIDKPVVLFSSIDLRGLKTLEDMITELFFNGSIGNDDQIYITNARQLDALKNTSVSLVNVLNAIDLGMTEDIFTVDLMDAYSSLGLITGETVEDDLANKIFKEFCMGK